jgi:hypothetical protein
MSVKKIYSKRQKKEVWLFEMTIYGKRYRDSGFATKREAEETVAFLRTHLVRARYGMPVAQTEVSLTDLVRARSQAFDTSNKNHRRALSVLEMFRDFFPIRKLVTELSDQDGREWAVIRATRGLKRSSINAELRFINVMLRAAENYFPVLEKWKPFTIPYVKDDRPAASKKWTPARIARARSLVAEHTPRAREAKRIWSLGGDWRRHWPDAASQVDEMLAESKPSEVAREHVARQFFDVSGEHLRKVLRRAATPNQKTGGI